MVRAALFALLFFVPGSPATAQDLQPIERTAQYHPTNVFIRCAAIYYAVYEWAGEQRLGHELSSELSSLVDMHIRAATTTYFSSNIGTTPEQSGDFVLRDVDAAINLYQERFARNVAATGEAINQDDLVRGDLEFCREAAQIQ